MQGSSKFESTVKAKDKSFYKRFDGLNKKKHGTRQGGDFCIFGDIKQRKQIVMESLNFQLNLAVNAY